MALCAIERHKFVSTCRHPIASASAELYAIAIHFGFVLDLKTIEVALAKCTCFCSGNQPSQCGLLGHA